jgi:hypothetical protein
MGLRGEVLAILLSQLPLKHKLASSIFVGRGPAVLFRKKVKPQGFGGSGHNVRGCDAAFRSRGSATVDEGEQLRWRCCDPHEPISASLITVRNPSRGLLRPRPQRRYTEKASVTHSPTLRFTSGVSLPRLSILMPRCCQTNAGSSVSIRGEGSCAIRLVCSAVVNERGRPGVTLVTQVTQLSRK